MGPHTVAFRRRTLLFRAETIFACAAAGFGRPPRRLNPERAGQLGDQATQCDLAVSGLRPTVGRDRPYDGAAPVHDQ